MTGPVAIVCRPAVAPGFALAGVVPSAAPDALAAAEILAGLVAAPPGDRPLVVLVEDVLLPGLPVALERRLTADPRLLVVPFPAAGGADATAPAAFLLELLRQAIGYRVRLA
jgi:hypothetical protein